MAVLQVAEEDLVVLVAVLLQPLEIMVLQLVEEDLVVVLPMAEEDQVDLVVVPQVTPATAHQTSKRFSDITLNH